MGISRNTVLAAFEQLYAEGYIEGQHGSGTYISEALPDEFLQTEPLKRVTEPVHGEPGNLSHRGRTIVTTPRTPLPALTNRTHQRAFTIGLPDLGAFPRDVWTSLVNRRLRQSSWELMRYGHPGGYAPLRKAIAARLAATRGVLCSPEQVIVVTGSQQALDFCARLLLDPGDSALVEDPGYLGARAALMAAGAELIPVPIDAEGLDIAPVVAKSPTARLAVVTPSYQFPLGVTMSLSRRLSLLDWASRIGAWVVEDDYDAEFRYVGRPRTALQGIDRQDRVIYVGTFSKSLFPGLRLGYLVPPSSLVDAFLAVHLSTDIHAHVLQQAVLTDFIEGGHLDRHLRRMRTRYAERQGLLVEAAQSKLDGLLELNPADAGLHLIGWLKPGLEDSLVAKTAATKGVDVWPLSLHAINPYPRQAILLGYASLTRSEIRIGMDRLRRAIGQQPAT